MKIVEGTSENFEAEVLKSEVPVLVDFNATWCPPCRALHPILEEMAENSNDYKIVTVDIGAESALAAAHDVSSIPCIIAYKDGQETDRRVGLQSRRRLEKMLGIE